MSKICAQPFKMTRAVGLKSNDRKPSHENNHYDKYNAFHTNLNGYITSTANTQFTSTLRAKLETGGFEQNQGKTKS